MVERPGRSGTGNDEGKSKGPIKVLHQSVWSTVFQTTRMASSPLKRVIYNWFPDRLIGFSLIKTILVLIHFGVNTFVFELMSNVIHFTFSLKCKVNDLPHLLTIEKQNLCKERYYVDGDVIPISSLSGEKYLILTLLTSRKTNIICRMYDPKLQ